MNLRHLFPWFVGSRRRGLPAFLHDRRRFRWLLDRERKRSDRNGIPFAVVALEMERSQLTGRSGRRLANLLRRRLRETDDAGIMQDGRLGILLPETPYFGAEKVASDLFELLPAELTPAAHEIYVYPSDHEERVRPQKQSEPVSTDAAPTLEALLVQQLPLWKRGLDIVVALGMLGATGPLLAAIAVAIRLTSRGPVVFEQRRDGLGGIPFVMYKFRTMAVDAEQLKVGLRKQSEQDGPAFKLADDPRVTWLGRWLRSTSLDELPQLWNVLRGDMSLVGPRPLPCDESAACRGWHRRRLSVTPGLTCVWQVEGRSRVSFGEWMRMDAAYVRDRSAAQDLSLLIRTVPAVLARRGAC